MRGAVKEMETTDFKKYLRDNPNLEKSNKNSLLSDMTPDPKARFLKRSNTEQKEIYCNIRW